MSLKTSLKKGRLYIYTTNGSKYVWTGGTNFSDPIDTNLKTKLSKYGFVINNNSLLEKNNYFFIDYGVSVNLSSANIDKTKVINGNSFSLLAAGAGTNKEWNNLILEGPITITINITDEEQIKINNDWTCNEIVNVLNKCLYNTTAFSIYRMSDYYEFFLFDTDQIGLKTKEPIFGTGYNFTIADIVGDTVQNGLKLSLLLTTGIESKLSQDYTELYNAVNGGTDQIEVIAKSSEMDQPNYQRISIFAEHIVQVTAEVFSLPENLRVR
jgi:hypothetical protein